MAKRGRRIVVWIACGAIVLSVVSLFVAHRLLRADPVWYTRVQMTPAEQAAGERRLLDSIATLHNAVGQSQVQVSRAGADPSTSPATFPSFEIRISEDEVNGTVTRWHEGNAGFRAALGDLTEPHIRFIDGRAEIAGRSEKFGSLISIDLSTQTNDRGEPVVQLGRPWAGRLPLSRGLINGKATVEKLRAGDEAGRLPASFLEALERLLSGEAVAPPIVAVSSSFNGDRLLPAQVEKLTIDNGELVATLRPFLPGSPSTQPAAIAAADTADTADTGAGR